MKFVFFTTVQQHVWVDTNVMYKIVLNSDIYPLEIVPSTEQWKQNKKQKTKKLSYNAFSYNFLWLITSDDFMIYSSALSNSFACRYRAEVMQNAFPKRNRQFSELQCTALAWTSQHFARQSSILFRPKHIIASFRKETNMTYMLQLLLFIHYLFISLICSVFLSIHWRTIPLTYPKKLKKI